MRTDGYIPNRWITRVDRLEGAGSELDTFNSRHNQFLLVLILPFKRLTFNALRKVSVYL